MELVRVSRRLAEEVDRLRFGPPVTHVYNPLVYARAAHEAYLRRYGAGRKQVLLLGMNPGPFGMAQTGVPFGDVTLVRDWLGIEAPVGKPDPEHPRRPVLGFACPRSEVSGSRLWGWARQRFGTAERFAARFFVYNYCPLAFLEASGRNATPDKLPAGERRPLLEACDRALRDVVGSLAPTWVIGVGTFAARRAEEALDGSGVRFGCVLHPSPASPKANADWEGEMERGLARCGIRIE
jgi:single-strand selective monofunctional uracil DNA glycosylase